MATGSNRALPDLIARLRLDTTDVEKAVSKVNSAGGQLSTGFEKAAVGAGKLETAQTRVIGSSKAVGAAHEEAAGKLKSVEEITSKTSAVFGEYGSAGEKLTSKLSALSGLQGLTGVGVAGIAASAALGLVVSVGKDAVESFVSMGEKVLNFQRVTGASAEESSRLVDVFQQVGISGDVASSAMFRMNSRLEGTTPATAKVADRLAALGVEIIKNKDGTIDLTQTLEAVAAAYAHAGNQSERDAIAFQAFGKSGKALIPILEQGAAGIKAMADQSQLVFTQQQLEQVHNFNIEMERASQEHEKFNQVVGSAVVPVLTGLTEAFNKNAEANAYADQKMKDFHGDQSLVSAQWAIYKNEGLKAADASRKDAEATKDLAKASQDAAREIENKRKEEDLDATAALGAADAWKANRDAQDSVVKAGQAVAAIEAESASFTQKHRIATEGLSIAQDNYNDAVTKYGKNSDQAAVAAKALDGAKLNLANTDRTNTDLADRLNAAYTHQSDAMIDAAKKTVELAAKQQEATGPAQSNMDKTLALIDALHQEESTLAPTSPLRKNIDGYIFQLETPAVQAAERLKTETLRILGELDTKEQALFQTMGTATSLSVQTDTEHQIQLWEEHRSKLVGKSIIPDMWSDILGVYQRMGGAVVGSMASTAYNAISQATTMANGIAYAVRGGLGDAMGVVISFANKINDALGTFGVHINVPQIGGAPQGPSGVHSLAAGGVVGRRVGDGFVADQPTILVGEGKGREFVIPEDPSHHDNALRLLTMAAQSLGVVGMQAGGILDWLPNAGPMVQGPTGGFTHAAILAATGGRAWDYMVPMGSPVYAGVPGTVLGGPGGGYGTSISFNMDQGGSVILGHLMRVLAAGHVAKGTEIALSDNTGFSTGPHLHFEVRGSSMAPGPGGAGIVDTHALIQAALGLITGPAHAAANLIPETWARSIANTIIDKVVANVSSRAGGGPVAPGNVYRVGERGPELFSPDRAGQIMPAGARGTDRQDDIVNVLVSIDGRLAEFTGKPRLAPQLAMQKWG